MLDLYSCKKQVDLEIKPTKKRVLSGQCLSNCNWILCFFNCLITGSKKCLKIRSLYVSLVSLLDLMFLVTDSESKFDGFSLYF